MLVVCGSANSWMLNNLVNNHGGLYGRTTYELKLHPFKLDECEQFFRSQQVNMSRYDIIQCYMILGGIPYYIRYFKKGLSLAQNLDQLFFAQDAKLKGEFDRLFASIFTNPEEMRRIVTILAKRHTGYTRKDLIQAAKLKDSGAVTKMLNALIASDFIQSYIPFGNTRREMRYKLCDNFCLFYLKLVLGKTELDPEFWMHNVNTPAINSWRGIAFEEVCFNHIAQIKGALSILGVSSTQSPLIIRGEGEKDSTQMDLVINRKDNVASVCEMKFYNEPFTVNKDFHLKLMHRSNLLAELLPKRTTIHHVLITTYGINHNEYSGDFQSVVLIDDLFR